MKKIILYIIPLMVACGTNENEAPKKVEPKKMEVAKASADFSNPVLIQGSSLGEMLQQFHKLGQFKMILPFIATDLRKEIGDEKIVSLLKELEWGFTMKLKSKTDEAGFILLNYESQLVATKHIRRLRVIIENDTAKIYPSKLNEGDIFE